MINQIYFQVSKWIKNNLDTYDATDKCFQNCNGAGKCSYCDMNGNDGYCCSGDSISKCPDQAIIVSHRFNHECVHQDLNLDDKANFCDRQNLIRIKFSADRNFCQSEKHQSVFNYDPPVMKVRKNIILCYSPRLIFSVFNKLKLS